MNFDSLIDRIGLSILTVQHLEIRFAGTETTVADKHVEQQGAKAPPVRCLPSFTRKGGRQRGTRYMNTPVTAKNGQREEEK